VTGVTITEVAGELYGLTPAEFIAGRDERARQARAAGQRDLAAAIKKLARPTASAWLVNQLARKAPEQMTRLYAVGEALAEAQRTLAGDRLRELAGERRQAISELVPAAADLAEELGQPASPAVLGEVRSTLEAALADPAAKSAVQSGCLTKSLAYAGIGEVDLSAALALPVDAAPRAGAKAGAAAKAGPAGRVSRAGQGSRAGPGSSAGKAGRGATGAAAATGPAAKVRAGADAAAATGARLAEAEGAAEDAAAALAEADRLVAAVAEQRQFLARRVAHLERELGQARAEDDQLARDGKQAERDRAAAVRAAGAARRRLDKLRKAGTAAG
jgi:hypothetical protein